MTLDGECVCSTSTNEIFFHTLRNLYNKMCVKNRPSPTILVSFYQLLTDATFSRRSLRHFYTYSEFHESLGQVRES